MSNIDIAHIQAQWTTNMNAWSADYDRVNSNALSAEWFVSPLEYFWPDGKSLFDRAFVGPTTPNKNFDEMAAPKIFKTAMKADFRAKMMVFAYMRQPIAKTYGLEIENGLMHFYHLDFLSCLNQWIYVIEGYCRQLFSSPSPNNVHSQEWIIPSIGNVTIDGFITTLTRSLGDYLDNALFKSTKDTMAENLRRHILLHGNLKNKDFFSQKNCLLLMFLLDALVVIEMAKNKEFPQVFEEQGNEAEMIKRRSSFYMAHIKDAMQDHNLCRRFLLDEHLIKRL